MTAALTLALAALLSSGDSARPPAPSTSPHGGATMETPPPESTTNFQREILMIDVEPGRLQVRQILFPAGPVETLMFTAPENASEVELENGFSEQTPIPITERTYSAHPVPGAFPLMIRYTVRTLGRDYELVKSVDTDAPEQSVLVARMLPAPHVETASFEGMREMGEGLYYIYRLPSDSATPTQIVAQFSGLPLPPTASRLVAGAFGLGLLSLLFLGRLKSA
ncbi:MAG: hypothetical protein HYY13_04055 [Nitrospirae bacterium]|nr:hypothetical protein [Nitrospirota bacterium]